MRFSDSIEVLDVEHFYAGMADMQTCTRPCLPCLPTLLIHFSHWLLLLLLMLMPMVMVMVALPQVWDIGCHGEQ